MWAIASIAPETIVYEQEVSYNETVVTIRNSKNPTTIASVEQKETAISSEVVVLVICESYTDYGCSCMQYLKIKGIQVSQKNASDLVPNYFGSPFHGDVAIFHYPDIAHASLVEEVYLSSFLVSEWNWKRGKYTERVIQKDDPALIGFIHRVDSPQNPI